MKYLSKEFSRALGFWESVLDRREFPVIERGKALTIARKKIMEGRPAYLRASKDSQKLMVYLEPIKNGLVQASVVPALHFITSHGLGRQIGTSDRLESFAEILKRGFDSPTVEQNAYMLTSKYNLERWQTGYPYQSESELYGWPTRKQNSQDRGEVVGDSLRVVLWSGFYGYIHESSFEYSKETEQNTIAVWDTPVGYVEGVVVTSPGSNWGQRVEFYQKLHKDRNLIAPIDIYDVRGNRVRVE